MKLTKEVKYLFTNVYFMYAVLILSIININCMLSQDNITGTLLFILIAALKFFYTDNMTFALFGAIVIVNILIILKIIKNPEAFSNIEPMESKEKKEEVIEKKEETDPKLDPFKTTMDSYKNIETILGSEAMTNMTKETESLISKQETLTKMVDKFSPMIGKLEGMMEKLNGFTGGSGGISDIIKKFMGEKSKENSKE